MNKLMSTAATIAFGVLVSVSGAVAAQNCPGGSHCAEVYNDCVASGQHMETYCRALRDDCIRDACGL